MHDIETYTLPDGMARPVWDIRLATLPVLRKLCAALELDTTGLKDVSARYLRYTLIGMLRSNGASAIVVKYDYRTRTWAHHLLSKFRGGQRTVMCSIVDERGMRAEKREQVQS
jgi:hypothetical protein